MFGGSFGGRVGVRVLVTNFGRDDRNPLHVKEPQNYGLVACLGGCFGGIVGVRVLVTDFGRDDRNPLQVNGPQNYGLVACVGVVLGIVFVSVYL